MNRYAAMGIACMLLTLVLVISGCRERASIPSVSELNEVSYKGHVYVVSQTARGYSVMSHAGHCPSAHNGNIE